MEAPASLPLIPGKNPQSKQTGLPTDWLPISKYDAASVGRPPLGQRRWGMSGDRMALTSNTPSQALSLVIPCSPPYEDKLRVNHWQASASLFMKAVLWKTGGAGACRSPKCPEESWAWDRAEQTERAWPGETAGHGSHRPTSISDSAHAPLGGLKWEIQE